ncbi:MAG: hypothetical protein ABH828_02405 [archaeon]
MIQLKNAQASLDFLLTYMWAFLIITTITGVLVYYGMFNAERFLPPQCNFDSNFFCHDHSVRKNSDLTFNVSLLLQNNMDNVITLNSSNLYDTNNVEIVCQNLKVFCRFNNTNYYSSASPNNGVVQINNPSVEWPETRLCRVEFEVCDKQVIVGEKVDLGIVLKFSGQGNNNTFLSHGNLFAGVI